MRRAGGRHRGGGSGDGDGGGALADGGVDERNSRSLGRKKVAKEVVRSARAAVLQQNQKVSFQIKGGESYNLQCMVRRLNVLLECHPCLNQPSDTFISTSVFSIGPSLNFFFRSPPTPKKVIEFK